MKQKLTITVDSELLCLARNYAQGRGVSVSSLFEQALREMGIQEAPTFAEKWRGKFQPAERENDPRYDSLANKYLP